MAAVCCIWECQRHREQAGSLGVGSGAPLQLCDQCRKRVSISGSGTLRTYTSCDILPWRKASASNFVWHRFLMVFPLSLMGVPSHDCSSHLLYKGGASSDLSRVPNTTAASFHPGGAVFPDNAACVAWIMSRNWWAQVRCWTLALPHEFSISFASEISWLMETLPFFHFSAGDVCLKRCAWLCREFHHDSEGHVAFARKISY